MPLRSDSNSIRLSMKSFSQPAASPECGAPGRATLNHKSRRRASSPRPPPAATIATMQSHIATHRDKRQ